MEALETLQKQELLALVLRVYGAYLIGSKTGGKNVETQANEQGFMGGWGAVHDCKTRPSAATQRC